MPSTVAVGEYVASLIVLMLSWRLALEDFGTDEQGAASDPPREQNMRGVEGLLALLPARFVAESGRRSTRERPWAVICRMPTCQEQRQGNGIPVTQRRNACTHGG